MAMYDVKLTDQSQVTQNPYAGSSLGSLKGGGMSFNFGGINDSPTAKWLWLGLAVVLTGGLALWYLNRKPSK